VLLAAGFCVFGSIARAADPPRLVEVFILAGQSNMEGKAKLSLLEYQADQPATRELYIRCGRTGSGSSATTCGSSFSIAAAS
jgi:hypothetical protein